MLKNTQNSVNALNLSENSKENSQILENSNNATNTHPQTPSAREGALQGKPSAQQGALPLENSTSQEGALNATSQGKGALISYTRKDGIRDEALSEVRKRYKDEKINKEDIFYWLKIP